MGERYLVSLNIKGKKCLVVGGGEVAERKVLGLLKCGARVKVVSPSVTPLLASLADRGKIEHKRAPYSHEDLENVFLVISSTDSEEINARVANECESRNILVNVVDDPGKGNFYVPAAVHRGSLTIAVSTDGKAPILARRLREELEKSFGPQYGEFVDMLYKARKYIINNVPDLQKRKQMLEKLVDREMLLLLKKGELKAVKERVENAYRGGRPQPPDSAG